MRTFGKILRELREKRGLTQQELSAIIKFSTTQISAWENGNLRIKPIQRRALADALGIDESDLMESAASPEDTVPCYNLVHAGPHFSPEDSEESLTRVPRRGFTSRPDAFALVVAGDSMEPYLTPGTHVYCEPLGEGDESRLIDGRDVVITVETRKGLSKQIGKWRWVDERTFQLIKVNPAYGPQTFPLDADVVKSIGVVVASCRDHRRVV